MSNLKARELLDKYLEGATTIEENAMLETWYMRHQDEALSEVDAVTKIEQLDQIRTRLVDYSNPIPVKTRKLWPLQKIAVAAAVIVIGFSAGLFYLNKGQQNNYLPEFVKDIPAGKNGAMLTLANGQKISINAAAAGNIAEQSGVTISKTADGQIVYQVKVGLHGKLEYNTLQTAKGQQTQIILPDHSKVYLNAASSIRYPSSFATLKDRKIELTGEAYFEIAKDSKHPFIVKTSLQQVQVLGTHFNINSYNDEPTLKTTLLEGSVKISYGQFEMMLKPGQQSALKMQPAARTKPNSVKTDITKADMNVSRADIDEVMAWKNGYFRFEEESLESVMRKIARWYNIDIAYAPDVPKHITLGGFISRSQNISAVLEMITRTENVRFKMEGNKVTVFKY